MSEQIKHECGIAMLRLLKPLEYYEKKYGNKYWALNRMYLLMEKQHNRGQDGAGLASIKFDTMPGVQYIHIAKSNTPQAIQDIFKSAFSDDNFLGEIYMGHLRYGTFGRNEMENLHPFLRESNWKTRSLVLEGNFNLTNIDEMMSKLIELGQHPVKTADTAIILEKIGHFLDKQVETIFKKYKAEGLNNMTITQKIAEELDLSTILKEASKRWDGGYVMAGIVGHGDSFVLRDANGIRPCYYYYDEEIAVVASERPVIQTAFNVLQDDIKELPCGNAIIIKRNGNIKVVPILPEAQPAKCSFERIYFSRGTDSEIYGERKCLGANLRDSILKTINYDVKNTVFSYIPNTASVAFQGLAQSLSEWVDQKRIQDILSAQQQGKLSKEALDEIFSTHPRREYIVVKDVKMRTFITNDEDRESMVAHVYDVTYGQVRNNIDNLVVLDDSIVRGTTLKESIIRILDRLRPKKIVVCSSAPQIRYPDCYGIDMSKLGDFIAFKATIVLLKERGMQNIIDSVYKKSKAQEYLPKEEIVNYVRELYKPFTNEEIAQSITKLLTPQGCNAEVEILYQTIEGLHQACPNNTGDWYFTGKYPTAGGNKVVNTSFINWYEGKTKRAY